MQNQQNKQGFEQLAQDLLKCDWSAFKKEESRYIAKQAIAILYHVITHDDSNYGLDGHYLSEKASKILEELK